MTGAKEGPGRGNGLVDTATSRSCNKGLAPGTHGKRLVSQAWDSKKKNVRKTGTRNGIPINKLVNLVPVSLPIILYLVPIVVLPGCQGVIPSRGRGRQAKGRNGAQHDEWREQQIFFSFSTPGLMASRFKL